MSVEPRSVVAVFAKRPVPGGVKTRLTPPLTPDQAARLYWAFTQDTWTRLERWGGAELMLFADEPWEGFAAFTGAVEIQSSGDLGMRMYSCFKRVQSLNFERSLIVGTDSPTLPLARLDEALAALDSPDSAVLGPTSDGGYYLVGCREPRKGMFEEVAWSAETTLEDTRRAFERVGYRTALLASWWDVDEPADLARLRRDSALGECTREVLAELGSPTLVP